MARLLGRYEYQIDAKGRVSFPSAFRRALGASREQDLDERPSSALVLLQWRETHLDLLPDATWENIQKRLMEHRRARGDAGAYLRRITARAIEVEPDDHGRIRIPPWLREDAGLDGSALFIGAIDRIEVWNPERFASEVAAQPSDDEFAPRIFG